MPKYNFKNLTEDFARNTKVKKEIYKLQNLIENPPQNSIVLDVTPDMAHYVINTLNKNNRPVKPAHLVRYARDMAAGNWGLTGDTIKFGTDGLLKDGQNRLIACFKSGKPFKTHVVFGAPPETFHQMDVGAKRDATDIFHIMGIQNAKHVAGSVKVIMAWKKGDTFSKTAADNEVLKKYYNEHIHAERLQTAIKCANSVFKIVKLPRNYLIALYYIASENGDELKVYQFFEDIKKGYGSNSRAPVPYMLKTFNKWMHDMSYTPNRHDNALLIVRSWRNFKRNINSKASDFVMMRTDTLGNI